MLLPVALMTRAICWLADRSSGGVRVSSAVARTFRRGGPILVFVLYLFIELFCGFLDLVCCGLRFSKKFCCRTGRGI